VRAFLVSVFASLVAAGILYVSPTIHSYFQNEKHVCLTVEISTEDFGDLKLVKILAINDSRYSFSRLNFHPLTDGRIMILGIVSPNERQSYTPNPGDNISRALDAGDRLLYHILIQNGFLSNDLQKLFSGTYSYIDSKGRVREGSIGIQSLTARQLEQYEYFAKWAGVILIIFFLSMLGLFIYSKKRQKRQLKEVD